MALVFSDENIKNISKDILLIPFTINDPENGMIAQKNRMLASKDNLLKTDEDQKLFSDLWISTISAYHSELLQLTAQQRSNYSDTEITKAAKKDSSAHYPVPTWTKLPVMLTPLVTGNPVTAVVMETESQRIAVIPPIISSLKNGFNDGPGTWNGDVLGTTISGTLPFTGIVPGNRLFITVAGTSFAVTVLTVTTGPDEITFSLLFGTPTDGVGAVITKQFIGFTDSQRSGVTPLGSMTGIYNAIKAELIAKVNLWKPNCVLQQTALASNSDLQPRKAHVQSAKADVDNTISVIDTWLGLPDLVANGITTNAALLNLENEMTARSAFILTRQSEIVADLGTVTQSPDGSYSGSGVYLELFKTVDLRASTGTGSLAKYFDADLGIVFFDKKIASANDQLAQYQNVMFVNKIDGDTVIGQDTFTMQSVTGLSLADEVKIMDNDAIVFTRTITQIAGLDVRLNSGIPTVLTAGGLSRITKLK